MKIPVLTYPAAAATLPFELSPRFSQQSSFVLLIANGFFLSHKSVIKIGAQRFQLSLSCILFL